jgi:hypothetical protein
VPTTWNDPAAGAVAFNVMAALAFARSTSNVHVATTDARVHEPPLVVADTLLAAEGSCSWTCTPVASKGPLFDTVYV